MHKLVFTLGATQHWGISFYTHILGVEWCTTLSLIILPLRGWMGALFRLVPLPADVLHPVCDKVVGGMHRNAPPITNTSGSFHCATCWFAGCCDSASLSCFSWSWYLHSNQIWCGENRLNIWVSRIKKGQKISNGVRLRVAQLLQCVS